MEKPNTCETCAACEVKTVPYILYEAAVERESRRAKRNLAAFIVALATLLVSNAAWVVSVVAR